jgi:predicted short-subunit dehydrogenase-like oxidoreductase (DUF2520 family)
MRELERDPSLEPSACTRLAVVGHGRLGTALVRALQEVVGATGRYRVVGPLGRGTDGRDADAVLLCVPDSEIAEAASLILPGRLVGHCSGVGGLDSLAPHESFSMHPLMTVAHGGTTFAGAGAAVDGSTPRALALAEELATMVGMRPVRITPEDRALYHAAASMASNFLVTLEAAAERLAEQAGLERAALAPLVRATVENWASLGPQGALTGPVARGDEATVRRQREAIEDRDPDVLPLFDALVEATRRLAASPDLEPQPA